MFGSARLARFAAVGLFVGTLGGALLLLGPAEARPSAGWVQEDRRTLGFTEAGHVLEVRVTEGQVVATGDVLAVLDPSGVDAEIAALEAESKALVDRARARAYGAEADRAASVDRRTSAAQSARAAKAKARALADAVAQVEAQVARGLGGGEDLATLRAEATTAAAEAKALEATSAALPSAGGAAPLMPDDAAAAQLDAVTRQLAALKVRRDALTVRAPVDGRVAGVLHGVGDVVAPGEAVVEVVAGTSERAIACVDASTAARLQERQRVAVADAALGVEVPGQVLAVGPAFAVADARCRLGLYQPGFVLPVVLRLEAQGVLVPGAGVRVRWLPEVAPPEDPELRVGRNPS